MIHRSQLMTLFHGTSHVHIRVSILNLRLVTEGSSGSTLIQAILSNGNSCQRSWHWFSRVGLRDGVSFTFFWSPLPSLWGISCLPAWYFCQITWCQQGIQGYVSIVEIWFACVHLWFHVCIYVMFCYITLDYIKFQYVMSWCYVWMLCLAMSCYAIYM